MSLSIPNSAGVSDDESRCPRGRLQLFLGYAAGVGKTYRMLEEAQHIKQQGTEVVVGYFEPHGRKDTIAKTAGLEMIPTKTIAYRGVMLPEMNTDAILRRRPAICVVDELAHTNVPGSEYCKRWEDVQVMLDTGINVMTNMNIQHLESLNDQIFSVTGIRVRETVPDWLVKSASEVVMVDATTEALLNRLRRGVIYAPEKTQRAIENFFKESTLAFLRELALRQTAHELESRGTTEVPDISSSGISHTPPPEKEARDRILIYLTEGPSTAMIIRRGRRMADYLGADCLAVCVLPRRSKIRPPNEAPGELQTHLNFARNLHIETRILEGDDAAQTIMDFVRRNQITQILLGRPKYSWGRLIRTDPILRIARKAKDVRVILVAARRRQR